MYLIVSMQANRYAFDLAQVAAVSEPVQCWPIPAPPDCYAGAANVHGTITAVIDLALFMGLTGRHAPTKMVVLAPKLAALAFLVEQVLKVVPEREVSFIAAPPTRFAAANLQYGAEQALLLDVAEMVRAAEELLAK